MIKESGYPEPGYFRVCVFAPEDESYQIPAMDRVYTREQIAQLNMTEVILDRIDQRKETDFSVSS